MNTYQNKEARKYLVFAAVVLCVMNIVFGVVMYMMGNYYKTTENKAVLSLLAVVSEKYPAADFSELVQALNSGEDFKADKKDELMEKLNKYGIDSSVYFIEKTKSVHSLAVVAGFGIFLVTDIIFIVIFVFYLRERQKKLFMLEYYMKRISRGDYSLDLSDNSEDELSSLKNELYKLTIMLKEQAEVAVARKAALAESVSDISHQLKNPLTSVRILLDNINENPEMDEAVKKKFIKEISKQVNQMSWLTISMLKLSRLDAGVVEFDIKEISVDRMINETIEMLEVIAELRSVEVKYSAAEGAVVMGDYNWMREALYNILKNAIEHSPVGEKVLIDVRQNSVYISVTVTNKGETLTEKQQRQIFERYYSEAKSDDNSIGIGLSLAKAILERQGGRLTVQSEEGETTFELKFNFHCVTEMSF